MLDIKKYLKYLEEETMISFRFLSTILFYQIFRSLRSFQVDHLRNKSIKLLNQNLDRRKLRNSVKEKKFKDI